MKRFLLGILILSLLLGAGIGVSFVFSRNFCWIQHRLQEAARVENPEAATAFQAAQARWERWQHFAAAFSDHAPLEEIETLFTLAQASASREEFSQLCLRLATLAGNLAQGLQAHWWTIL